MIQSIIFYILLYISLFGLLSSCHPENTKNDEKKLMPLVKSYKREFAWLVNTKGYFFSYNKHELSNPGIKDSQSECETGSLKKAKSELGRSMLFGTLVCSHACGDFCICNEDLRKPRLSFMYQAVSCNGQEIDPDPISDDLLNASQRLTGRAEYIQSKCRNWKQRNEQENRAEKHICECEHIFLLSSYQADIMRICRSLSRKYYGKVFN